MKLFRNIRSMDSRCPCGCGRSRLACTRVVATDDIALTAEPITQQYGALSSVLTARMDRLESDIENLTVQVDALRVLDRALRHKRHRARDGARRGKHSAPQIIADRASRLSIEDEQEAFHRRENAHLAVMAPIHRARVEAREDFWKSQEVH